MKAAVAAAEAATAADERMKHDRENDRERESVVEGERGDTRVKESRSQAAGRAYGLHPYLLTSAKSITCLGV